MDKSLFARLRLSTRLPIMALVIGPALLYFAWFGPRASRSHPVVFRFQPELSDVRRLTATWTDPREASEPIGGSRFDVAAGGPTEFRSNVQAPDGEVWVDLEVEREGGRFSIQRRVQLGDGEITILLPVPESSEPR